MPQPRAQGPHQHLASQGPGQDGTAAAHVGGDGGMPPLLFRSSGRAVGFRARRGCLQQHLLDTDLLQDGG